ncbi:MAG: dihydrofolate reductase [Proteobacteria bacterium]|nr:MAG: dihydrofolate reductase [Pseudomonadota bacterium]
MILSAIAAMAANRVIGKDGDLPWKIPEDMKFFRDKTSGHIMIMGRKTFDSFGGKPLPNRLNVVITRQHDYEPEGAHVVNNTEEAIDFCRGLVDSGAWPEEVFIIGGGEIYKQMLPATDRIYLTEIHEDVTGDTKFPEFSDDDFEEIERHPRKKPVEFDFVTYERI